MDDPTGETNSGNVAPATAPQISDEKAQRLLADAVRQNESGASPPAGSGGDGQRRGVDQGPVVNEHGYPDNTPLAEMTPAQQAAYWKFQARKHEQRVKTMADYEELRAKAAERDALVEASRTDQERAVDEARRQGRAEGLKEASGRLVEAHLRVAAGDRVSGEALDQLLANLNMAQFLTSGGEVDADRVTTFVNTLLPRQPPAPVVEQQPQQQVQQEPPRRVPDLGQGRREVSATSGLEAGRAAARARLGLDKQTQAA